MNPHQNPGASPSCEDQLGGTQCNSARVVVCMTVDVEDSDTTALLNIKNICQKHQAPVTWFIDPELSNEPAHTKMLQDFVKNGDEVGLHVHWRGAYAVGLDKTPIDTIKTQLDETMRILKPHFQLKSFRGGGLCQTTEVLHLIQDAGFEFDSSVAHNLSEDTGWFQKHYHVPPVSAYYPSVDHYDRIGATENQCMEILEIPVTRGHGSLHAWNNFLSPGETPLWRMKIIARQALSRTLTQPLVILVLLIHSWTRHKHPKTLRDLDTILRYLSAHHVEYHTISTAGYTWQEFWQEHPRLQSQLTSCNIRFDGTTRLLTGVNKISLYIQHFVTQSSRLLYRTLKTRLR